MRNTRAGKSLKLLSVAITMAVIASACGSAKNAASTTAAATATTAGAAATTAAGADTTAAATSGDTGTTASAGSVAAPTGDPIIIGHTSGLTGFMSVFDVAVEQGMNLAIKDINKNGGVLGRPLELVTSNNETDFAKIQTSALEVIEKGAQFIVPSCDFDVGSPAARVANDKNIIAIGCAGGPLFGFTGIGPLTYNTYHSSPVEGSLMAEFAKDKGWKKPFVLTDQTLAYSQSVGDTFAARWKELGGTIAGQDIFNSDNTSIASQIAAIQASGADSIMVASLPPEGPTALLQIRAAGIDLPMMGAQAFDGTYWVKSIPDISDFYIPATASIYGDDPVKARNAFFARIKTETGTAAVNSNYPLSGYSSVEALARAMERAGSTDTKKVAAELDKFTNEDLLIGPTTYTPTCHIPTSRPLLIIEYVKGTPSVVEQRSVKGVAGGVPC
jgi:branched-chain amino acid transport system substrate-binding protein